MNQQHPQLEGLAGATNPRRHRMRRLATMLVLCGLVVATVAVAASLVRTIFFPRSAVRWGTADVQPAAAASQSADTERAVTVEDASADEDAAASEEAVESAAKADDDAAEQATPAEPEPVRVRLMMIGDVLMHDAVIYSGQREDGTFNYDHLFSHIASDVQAADVAVLNQETILGGEAFAYAGYPQFNSPQALGEAEAAVGFDVILKATNHTLDMGYAGVREELAYWAQNHPEMAVIGMADPDGDGVCPAGTTSPAGAYIFEKDGLRVAMLNYTYWFNLNVDYDHDYQVVAGFDEESIRADIAAAREAADVVVVYPHWGNEYETVPSDEERYWAGVFQDAGADVVIGGHPHVIQPVEVLGEGDDQMLVFWSVGNFVSTMASAGTMVGGMATVEFVKDTQGVRVGEYEFMPLVTQREPYGTNMTTYKLCDYTDELAATSSIRELDPNEGYSKEWYVDYCATVLGDSFDRETESVHGSLS